MIDKRDYKSLTDAETKEFEKIKNDEITVSGSGLLQTRKNLFARYPKAARHNIQLFPNHYLDTVELKNPELILSKAKEFENILNSKETTERKLLNQINNNEHFFIIGALLKKYYNFGHHGAHIFYEFPLGTSFKVDYLLLGKNSDGWHFVFVELESPTGSITIEDGELGSVFRKGEKQIRDWDLWLENNFGSLQEYFSKHIKVSDQLPNEFIRLDKSRINYVVVAGRRENFHEKTYRIQRKKFKEQQIFLIHYDNILDAIELLSENKIY